MTRFGAFDEAGVLQQERVEVGADDEPAALVGHVLNIQFPSGFHDGEIRVGGGADGHGLGWRADGRVHEIGDVVLHVLHHVVGGGIGELSGHVRLGLSLVEIVDLEGEIVGLIDFKDGCFLVIGIVDGDRLAADVLAHGHVVVSGDVDGIAGLTDVALIIAVAQAREDELRAQGFEDGGGPYLGNEIGDCHCWWPPYLLRPASRSSRRPLRRASSICFVVMFFRSSLVSCPA